MANPTGTVTFLFTDIEGSTRLARELRGGWEALRARHHAILRAAIEGNGGYVFQIVGDGFCAAFHNGGDAISAAVESQKLLQAEDWGEAPVRVRMGIHTGKADLQDGSDYVGYMTLSRVQRLMSAGHGGQVLLSHATEQLVHDELPDGVALCDLGERPLRDLVRAERIFQLNIPGLPVEFAPLSSLEAVRHNLPVQLTSFVGRESEMAEIKGTIGQHRLVTLTGPGGSGKTRLALQVAADLLDQFPDGVWFIELASLETAEAIAPTVAKVVGFSFYQGSQPRQQLLNYLRGKIMLLILDNFEHLLAGVSLVNDILTSAPQVKILSTSRSRLGARSEQLFHLAGMDLPDLDTPGDPRECGAVRLFLQGARRVCPDFELVSDSLNHLAHVCRLVEGLPLGILLASAWVEMLAPKEIAQEIEKSLDFLETAERDVPDRQRSLRAVFDHTWDLLTPGEQEAFDSLSVFRGGFMREAATEITRTSLRDLVGLVDKSLLQRAPSGRYTLHELLRQYGEQKLREGGSESALRQRHLEYYLLLAEQSLGENIRSIQMEWLPLMAAENDNLQAALGWCRDSGNVQMGLRLAVRLGYFWLQSGLLREGQAWLERFLAGAPEPTRSRAAGLQYLALLVYNMGDYASALPRFEESLALFEALGDLSGIADTTFRLAWLHLAVGNHAESRTLLQRSLKLYQELNKPEEVAYVIEWLGDVARVEGDFVRARELLEQSVALQRGLEDKVRLCYVLSDLGCVLIHFNELDQSETVLKEMVSLQLEMGKEALSTSLSFMDFAFLANAQGLPRRAVQLLGAWETLCKATGYHVEGPERPDYESNLASLRAQLSVRAFEDAWEQGQAMSLEQATKYALEETP